MENKQKSNQGYPRQISHYSSDQYILTVGDGDFSFSSCLATGFDIAKNMVATSLDSKYLLQKKYGVDAVNNIKNLTSRGARVIHKVNVRTMAKNEAFLQSAGRASYDCIIFNFPHAGFFKGENHEYTIGMHKDLLKHFFANVALMLSIQGRIHVSHKLGFPYDDWKLHELAQISGLYLEKIIPFQPTIYPGYVNRCGAGFSPGRTFWLGKAATYIFKLGFKHLITSFPLDKSPPISTTLTFPWNTLSPPISTSPTFPWNTLSPLVSTGPTFPWNTLSPLVSTGPTFPRNTPSPPISTGPSFRWNTPSPLVSTGPTFPWNTPFSPVSTGPTFPWNSSSSPVATGPTFPWHIPPPPPPRAWTRPWLTPPSPLQWVGPSLPPFGLHPGGPFFPTGIQFTFSNFTQSWLPDVGVKVTWESVISVELSLQLFVEALVKPIMLIIEQFDSPSNGPPAWGWKNGFIESKLGAHVGATCTTSNKDGFPTKGLIIIQTPIDNTYDIAVTWFTVLFNGWSREKPFNATLDSTQGSFGGFVTNTTLPDLNTFCSRPSSLPKRAAKQGLQYVFN